LTDALIMAASFQAVAPVFLQLIQLLHIAPPTGRARMW